MPKIYIGVDNGVSGTIGIVGDGIEPFTTKTPIKREQDYTKAKKEIARLDVVEFQSILNRYNHNNITVVLERPLVNPKMFKSTVSALRCFEAQLVMLEMLGIRYMFIDSKEWQKAMLPKGCTGTELKKASLDIGTRLFPSCFIKHPDRDGILIAEYARRMNL